MASNRSSLSSFWRCSPAFTVALVWILLLGRADFYNQSDEIAILLRFKETNWNTIGDSTGVTMTGYWINWKGSEENPCYWVGVTCSANYTVWELDFSGWGFGGLDLSLLSNLRDLRELDLSSNHMPQFPSGICNLTGLTRLDLSANFIEDDVPLCIAACRNLRFISFQQNLIIGEIPKSLGGLLHLESLLLADNSLSGPFPKELGELSSLSFLDLSNNALNGSIPALPNVANLLELKLDNNFFTDFEEPWIIGANTTLQQLSVSFNQLGGVIPSGITNLLNLEYLNMSHNRLSGSIPSGFSQLFRNFYFSLDLSQNRLNGTIPADMLSNNFSTSCPQLNLSHNQLVGGIPIANEDADLPCFGLLDFSYNSLSGPFSWSILTGFAVFTLRLQNNHLTGDIVDGILRGSGFGSVNELQLQNNLLTGDLSKIVNGSLKQGSLFTLDLSNNNLRWSTSETNLDPIRATLETLSFANSLVEFRVGGNNFSGTSLPSACFLDTANGPNYTSLQSLDLSNSHLKGEISGEAFNRMCLPYLGFLNVSNNEVNGSIPQDFIGLNMTNKVPLVLDVSNNKLSGPLPYIPPDSSLAKPNIYAGNVGLCGYPLDPCPQDTGGTGVPWWALLVIIGGSLAIAMGSCLAATWRWRLYHKRNQQDAELINALLERDSTTLMSLRQLKKATNNFAESAQIGEGGFGTVYKGTLNDGTEVAIKRSKQEGSDMDKEQFLNEVKILSQLNHRYLVKLLGCCMENKVALLVFEFVSNGTLQEHLQGKIQVVRLSWRQRLNIAIQTASGLNYLHTEASFPIYHRDVKSANILLNNDLNAKVADFGISKLAPLQATHVSTVKVQGTMGYIDPEYYTSYQFTDKSDVYSFGIVLLELISAKAALDFKRGGEDNSLVNLAGPHIKRGDLLGFIDPILLETYNVHGGLEKESILNVGRLAMKCVDMRSRRRPTMNEVLKELQKFWIELCGTLEQMEPRGELHMGSISEDSLESRDEDDHEGSQYGQTLLLSKAFANRSCNLTMQSDPGSIELSHFSSRTWFRSKSMC